MSEKKISGAVLRRLPVYLHYLKSLPEREQKTISSSAIAAALKLGDVQVRKDLALVSGEGKPKIGYYVSALISRLEKTLGSRNITKAVVVGAGKLGKALMFYEGFPEYGIEINAAFDCDASKYGALASGKEVMPMEKLADYCAAQNIVVSERLFRAFFESRLFVRRKARICKHIRHVESRNALSGDEIELFYIVCSVSVARGFDYRRKYRRVEPLRLSVYRLHCGNLAGEPRLALVLFRREKFFGADGKREHARVRHIFGRGI